MAAQSRWSRRFSAAPSAESVPFSSRIARANNMPFRLSTKHDCELSARLSTGSKRRSLSVDWVTSRKHFAYPRQTNHRKTLAVMPNSVKLVISAAKSEALRPEARASSWASRSWTNATRTGAESAAGTRMPFVPPLPRVFITRRPRPIHTLPDISNLPCPQNRYTSAGPTILPKRPFVSSTPRVFPYLTGVPAGHGRHPQQRAGRPYSAPCTKRSPRQRLPRKTRRRRTTHRTRGFRRHASTNISSASRRWAATPNSLRRRCLPPMFHAPTLANSGMISTSWPTIVCTIRRTDSCLVFSEIACTVFINRTN